MEPNQIPVQQTTVLQTANKASVQSELRPGYFKRLFTGRLNRQNYIIGSTFFALVPTIFFLIVIVNIILSPNTLAMPYLNPNNPSQIITPQVSIPSLLETPENELWSALGIFSIILSIPYLFSMQIRRLHDLNLTGWLWIANFVPLVSLYTTPIPGMYTPPQNNLTTIFNVLAFITTLFSLYVSLWPGTKGLNKYGEKPLPGSSFLRDILVIK
jgi:uncharacterized membrane protein YhaH (DUF805 family)